MENHYLHSILDEVMVCPSCGFECRLELGRPDNDDDGSIGCPICFTDMVMHGDEG